MNPLRVLFLVAASTLFFCCATTSDGPVGPDPELDYRYGMALIERGDYQAARDFAESKTTDGTRAPSPRIAWVWARALFELGDRAGAGRVAAAALEDGADPYWTVYLQHELFRALDLAYRERLGPDLSAAGDRYGALPIGDIPRGVPAEVMEKARYHLAAYGVSQAIESQAANDNERYERYCALVDRLVAAGLGRHEKDFAQMEFDVYRAIPEAAGRIIIPFEMLLLDQTDTGAVDGTFEDHDETRYRRQFELFARLVASITDGALVPKLQTVRHEPSRLTAIETREWIDAYGNSRSFEFYAQTAIQPPLHESTDTAIRIVVAPLHDGPYVSFVHGGSIYLSSDAAARHRSLVHEFFHLIEARLDEIGIHLTRHVYEQQYRELQPMWYDGDGELSYYHQAYDNVVRAQVDRLFGAQPWSISVHDVEHTVRITYVDATPDDRTAAAGLDANLLAAVASLFSQLRIEQPVRLGIAVRFSSTEPTGCSSTDFVRIGSGVPPVYEQLFAAVLRDRQRYGDGTQIELILNREFLVRFWFDPSPRTRDGLLPDRGRLDAMTVLLHELLHALCFNGWLDSDTGASHSPNGTRSTYDCNVVARDGRLWFEGARAMAVFGGPVPLARDRTNYKHYGEPGLPTDYRLDDKLMYAGGHQHPFRAQISDLDRAIMADCGIAVR